MSELLKVMGGRGGQLFMVQSIQNVSSSFYSPQSYGLSIAEASF